jgi:putative tryptophan/tyrosine transport system substrate-binding protein
MGKLGLCWLLLNLSLLSGCGPVAALPAQAPRQARVGVLDTGFAGSNAQPIGALVEGLRKRGLAEGDNLVIEYRFAEGHEDRLTPLAAELASIPVDVIVATTTQGTRAALDSTGRVPVVFTGLQDPVAAGLVDSLAHPARNATGTTLMTPQLHGKRLQILTQIVPNLQRVAVIANPTSVGLSVNQVEDAARPLGLQLQVMQVNRTDEFEATFDAAVRARAQAIMVLPDALFFNNRARMIALATNRSLPDMYWAREFTDEGALLAYGGNRADAFRRAASYVDKILHGAAAGDLPVEQASQFDFVINMKQAGTLGLTVNHELLVQATDLIR